MAAGGRILRAAALPAALLPLIPIAYLVVRAGGAGSDAWRDTLDAGLVEIATRSLLLSALVALGTVLVAVPYAFLVVRTDLPARRVWALVGALPLVVPSYVGAFALVGAFGPRGLLQGLLEPFGVERLPELYGFTGALVVLVLFTYPYVLLLVTSAWRRVDQSLERAARGMGQSPWGAFRHATLPQLRSTIVAGSLLSGLYALGDFGVVATLRVDTFTRQIYLRYGSLFDREGAAILALVLCMMTVVALIIERRVLRGHQRAARRRVAARDALAPVALGRWRWAALTFVATIAAFSLVIPLSVLTWWLATIGMDGGWFDRLGELVQLAGSSVLSSGLGALVASVVALPVAMLVVRSPGRTSAVIETVVYTGYALPGLVAALGLTYFATRNAFWLYQSLTLLVIAYVIRFLPQAVGSTRASLERVNPRLEAAARGMGAGAGSVLRRVTLPLAGPGILAGAMLVFLTCMKELPATLVLRPTGFETLATEIWNQTAVANYDEAALPALALVAISAVPLWLLVIRPATGEIEAVTRASGEVPGDSGAGD